MRTIALGLTLIILSLPLLADSGFRMDKGQGESAMRLIGVGETVRLYCKPCSDVVYTTIEVKTRELRPVGDLMQLVINGQVVDVAEVHFDTGYGDGWDNLSEVLGFTPESKAKKLSRALDEVADVLPHMGHYTGKVGEVVGQLEFVLDQRRVTGSLELAGQSKARKLSATAFGVTRQSETMALVERNASDRLTATWRGQFDATAGTFSGERTPLDGSPAQQFLLTRAQPK